MEILEPPESEPLNESPNSTELHDVEDHPELEFLGSLDVAMDGGETGEVVEGQGVTPDENHAQEPVRHTLDEVMGMEFDNPDSAIRFYEAYSRSKGFSMRRGRKLCHIST
ncbi:hypothetical protein PIB30_065327 [Stylosanthes scabra]|uniref:FAR1 domain-containing protein n=1 Tax=Stylosanthes scabra TaxID=79078 RepID=A0ABU6QLX2_9FABA|nr:hypothetical protein [Stylosanthes scabra]